jgi:hypothetical protein
MRGRRVVRSLGPRVEHRRSGLPDIGVSTSRFEGRYTWSGPQGPQDHVLRVERALRRLSRAVEHVAEGQEKQSGTLQGCSRGGAGIIKDSHNIRTRRSARSPPCEGQFATFLGLVRDRLHPGHRKISGITDSSTTGTISVTGHVEHLTRALRVSLQGLSTLFTSVIQALTMVIGGSGDRGLII